MKKWSITLEWIRSVWIIQVCLGKEIRGTGTADDLDTAYRMGREMLETELKEPWPNNISDFQLKADEKIQLAPPVQL